MAFNEDSKDVLPTNGCWKGGFTRPGETGRSDVVGQPDEQADLVRPHMAGHPDKAGHTDEPKAGDRFVGRGNPRPVGVRFELLSNGGWSSVLPEERQSRHRSTQILILWWNTHRLALPRLFWEPVSLLCSHFQKLWRSCSAYPDLALVPVN
ncbi:hypothetical protein Nepgr_001604 [Nepenthes gracilis]|uniref:Uncharacterized protein n=1 Tax=Nepenthes gracilis TaxID=150966 RepID=A0AAD3RXV5_NEPGR|nr:hypothetical protein Nepgr_001604 [Nepenthes gracilis]